MASKRATRVPAARSCAAPHTSSLADPTGSKSAGQQAHERLIRIMEMLPDAIEIVSPTGQLITCNSHFLQLERQLGPLSGSGEQLATTIQPHGSVDEEAGSINQPRSWDEISNAGRWLRIRESRAANGEIIRICTDITEMRQRDMSFEFMFESNPVPMWVHDRDNLQLMKVNEAAIAHYGYSREQFLQMTIFDLLVPEQHVDAQEALRCGRERAGDKVREHIKADGTRISVSLYSRYFTCGDRPARLVAAVDVTEQRKKEEKITHLAYHDALTGLPNRSLFRKRLAESFAKSRDSNSSFTVFFIDLDHFKAINDCFGHAAGDELLRQAAARMCACVHDADTIARLGGDEFAVISTAVVNSTGAGMLATQLISSVRQPYLIEKNEFAIGASIGIAIAPVDGDDLEVLLENADRALYKAKAKGRGIYQFVS